MNISKVEFIKGVIGDDYDLKDNLSQVAFFGRSNVGKSSLINSLIDRKKFVKTSKIPGKTTEANFFRINNSFHFIDFPGYGYAKRSIKERNKMIKRIFWYIEKSNIKPRVVVLVIDIKAGLTSLDNEMIDLLKKNNHKVIIVANKIDKLSKEIVEKKIADIREQYSNFIIFPYSAKTRKKRQELLDEILKFIKI